MKYFTKEMWLDWQNPTSTGSEASDHARRCRAYNRQLMKLRGRLDARSFRFFTQETLHDGRLISLKIADESGRRMAANKKQIPFPGFPLEVELIATKRTSPGIRPVIFQIRYRRIRKLIVDCPSDKPLFGPPGGRFDDWGYDELTAAGKDFLRHEILFSSGSTILIEAGRISVQAIRSRKLKRKRGTT